MGPVKSDSRHAVLQTSCGIGMFKILYNIYSGSSAGMEHQQKSRRPILAKHIMVLSIVIVTDGLSIHATH